MTTDYKYKVRTNLGFTGVTLYDEKNSLATITQGVDSTRQRLEAKKLARKLNSALDNGREEVLRLINLVSNYHNATLDNLIKEAQKKYGRLLS
jgi:hypothetical protein